jgi:hypothetical protein
MNWLHPTWWAHRARYGLSWNSLSRKVRRPLWRLRDRYLDWRYGPEMENEETQEIQP